MAERMGTYCTVISGYAFKSGDLAEGVDIPVIKIGNISNGDKVIVDGDTQYVDSRVLSLDKKYHINKGDILISLTGSHMNQPNSMVGRCCRNREDQLFLLNQRAGKIIPNENADKDFLYYVFRLSSMQFAIANRAYGGANQVNVSPKDIMGIKMDIPALPVQKKIGKILSTYDSLIENNNKRIRVLERMAENLYKEWFVRFRFPGYEDAEFENGIPTGWEVVKVKNCLRRLPFNRLYKQDELEVSGKVIVIDQSASELMGYHNNEPSHYASFEEPIILFGDHSCKFVFMTKNFSLGENVVPFKSISTELFDDYYLYYATQKLIITEEYKRHWGRFTAMKIFKPQIDLQRKFAEFVKPLLQEKEMLWLQNQNLLKQRELLLPRLMSGKLEVAQAAEPQPKTTIITFENFVSKLGMAARGTAMSEADLRAMYQAYLDDDATE